MEHWNVRATYEDGFEIDRDFPYNADGNPNREDDEQYELEEWVLGEHEGCTWYSVNYVAE